MKNNGALIFLQNFLVRRRTAAFLHITSWRWNDSIPNISNCAILISSVINRSFQVGGFGLALRPSPCLFGRLAMVLSIYDLEDGGGPSHLSPSSSTGLIRGSMSRR